MGIFSGVPYVAVVLENTILPTPAARMASSRWNDPSTLLP